MKKFLFLFFLAVFSVYLRVDAGEEGLGLLCAAIVEGNSDLVVEYIKGDESLLTKTSFEENFYFMTPLVVAVTYEKLEIISILLDKTVSYEQSDKSGKPLLFIAIEKNNRAMIEMLLNKGFDINARDREGRSCLHHAVLCGNKAMVEFFLNKGLSVRMNKTLGEGVVKHEPIHEVANFCGGIPEASVQDRLEVLRLLVDSGADINAQDFYGRTLLYQVSKEPSLLSLKQYLLEQGADSFLQDRAGEVANVSLSEQFSSGNGWAYFKRSVPSAKDILPVSGILASLIFMFDFYFFEVAHQKEEKDFQLKSKMEVIQVKTKEFIKDFLGNPREHKKSWSIIGFTLLLLLKG